MKKIVALVDFSDATAGVVKLATDSARAFGAKLTLLHVSSAGCDWDGDEPPVDLSPQVVAAALHRSERRLKIFEKECKVLGVDAAAVLVCGTSARGRPARKVLEEMSRLAPDLIVVGSHGHGALYELLLGGVSAAVIHRARCPVLVVPPATRQAGVDSPASGDAG